MVQKRSTPKYNDASLFSDESRRVIDYCKQFNIEKIVVGYNKNWKQGSKLGKAYQVGNRHFQKVPFSRFLKYLFDKAESEGIDICENEESECIASTYQNVTL